MIGFLTIGSAATTRQPISNMINYATNTKIDTIYYNLLSLSELLSTVNNRSLKNFQTILSYFIIKIRCPKYLPKHREHDWIFNNRQRIYYISNYSKHTILFN